MLHSAHAPSDAAVDGAQADLLFDHVTEQLPVVIEHLAEHLVEVQEDLAAFTAFPTDGWM